MAKSRYDQPSHKNQLPEALEGAFILLLAQNAFLFSKPLVALGQGAKIQVIHGIIIAVAFVNFFNIAANWISSRQIYRSEVRYSQPHLFWDILILAVFFILTQTLIDLCGPQFSISKIAAAAITGALYLLLNLLFIVWNSVELRNLRKAHSKTVKESIILLKQANVRNAISAFLALVLLLASIFTFFNQALETAFAIWLANWLIVIVSYVRANRLFDKVT